MPFKDIWPCIVATAFALGLIAMFLTAYVSNVEVSWEIWWEIPFVLVLCVSAWIVVILRK